MCTCIDVGIDATMHVSVLAWMLNTQSVCTTQPSRSDPLMSVALSHGLAQTSVRHGHQGGTIATFPAPLPSVFMHAMMPHAFPLLPQRILMQRRLDFVVCLMNLLIAA